MHLLIWIFYLSFKPFEHCFNKLQFIDFGFHEFYKWFNYFFVLDFLSMFVTQQPLDGGYTMTMG